VFLVRNVTRPRQKELGAGTQLQDAGSSRDEFQHMPRTRWRESHTPWSHVRRYCDDLELGVEEYCVDGVPQPEGMNTASWAEQKRLVALQPRNREESREALAKCARVKYAPANPAAVRHPQTDRVHKPTLHCLLRILSPREP
jgi:hypothetical protein